MWHEEYVIEGGLYNHNASETLVKDVLKKISGFFFPASSTGWQVFYGGQRKNILGFVGHTISCNYSILQF